MEFTFENKEYRDMYRHTTSHILAQAVKRLYPDAKLAIGPAIEDGFYYDIDCETVFTPETLVALEAEMRKICKEKLKLERFELPREEALKLMEEMNEPYKVELDNYLKMLEEAKKRDHRKLGKELGLYMLRDEGPV